jgi:16S rRNA (guanine(966)-N(2))-methyltransferase RsmD
MGLRIVGGTAKGRKLKGPKKTGIRPASARVRKSLFEILSPLEDMVILDLFAGTGSMGMEALSKGAKEVTFVDNDRHAISLLFENLTRTGFLSQAHVVKKSAQLAIPWLSQRGKHYDLIFLDPPYNQGHVDGCLKLLLKFSLLKSDGMVVCEHSPQEKPTIFSGLEVADERKYGQTLVTFLRIVP